MKINQFDLTIDVKRNTVDAVGHTSKGKKFLSEVYENNWEPDQVIANVPPGVKLGVRTTPRKKFVLVPPHSLH